jgi:hypothetical protein
MSDKKVSSPPNGGKSPGDLLREWVPPGAADVVGPAPQPVAPPQEAPIDERVLAFLKTTEPFSTLVRMITGNAAGADKALAGGQPPLPPAGAQAPAVLDPTVRALRNGTSASIPNQ